MKNCIIAQSGGPTSVINASVIGIFESNLKQKYFDKVYFGINGIEGILNNKIVCSDSLDKNTILNLKHTPSSGLGSCRYKLDNYLDNSVDYEKTINILKNYNIDTFFYIGGNDSMDTVLKFSKYCLDKKIDINFIGIPKTIDNDLVYTDNCPGFGSAAKFISTIALETYLDSCIYKNNGVFILETMGRDTGWLAASTVVAKIGEEFIADLIYLPEVPFYEQDFIKKVENLLKIKNTVYIVISEGIKNDKGSFIHKNTPMSYDKFKHSQLGGVSSYLKQLLLNNVTNRVKSLELGITQRCAMHCVSNTDIIQSYKVGEYGLELAKQQLTGIMPIIKRTSNNPYKYEIEHIEIQNIANKIKYFPKEWIDIEKSHIKKDAIQYFEPLIDGNEQLMYKNGLPEFSKIY